MLLTKIVLENFQGIRDLTLEFPAGCSGSIYGDNATGKTTAVNAYTWLLFDKASTGAKGFTPKTRDANGEIHRLNHGVAGTFRAEDGREITLRKVYHEIYKKKRGAAHEEFDGHSVDYYVDGVPVKEKEYSATILNLCGGDIERLKILSMPDYFAETMPWDSRRKILLDVCGDITDEEVIASNLELKELPNFLKISGTDRNHTIEEYRKIATAQRREINDNLKSIPQRVDEAQKAIPDVSGLGRDAVMQKIKEKEQRIDALNMERAAITSAGNTMAETQKQIAEVQTQIAEGRSKHLEKQGIANKRINDQALAAKTEEIRHRQTKAELETSLKRAVESRDAIKARRDALLIEYAEVRKTQWEKERETCPTCGQKLPQEKIAQMREEFNKNRSEHLTAINEKGRTEASKEMLAAAQAEIVRLQDQLDSETSALERAETEAAEIMAQRKEEIPYESTEEYKDLSAQVDRLREEMLNAASRQSQITSGIDDKIQTAKDELREAQEELSRISIAESQEKRISELERQLHELSEEYDKTEKGLYLCDLFTRTKVSMLDNRINGKFKHVRFQLFTEQINGGIKEGCEVLVPADDGRLVPYAYANNAARINAGLEIIESLSSSWGIHMPVFIDNAEAVTHLTETNLQTIRLVVSEEDKTLRLKLTA